MDVIFLIASTLLAGGAIVAICRDRRALRRLTRQQRCLFSRTLLLVLDDRLAALEGRHG